MLDRLDLDPTEVVAGRARAIQAFKPGITLSIEVNGLHRRGLLSTVSLSR
jgi:hypothetical protein